MSAKQGAKQKQGDWWWLALPGQAPQPTDWHYLAASVMPMCCSSSSSSCSCQFGTELFHWHLHFKPLKSAPQQKAQRSSSAQCNCIIGWSNRNTSSYGKVSIKSRCQKIGLSSAGRREASEGFKKENDLPRSAEGGGRGGEEKKVAQVFWVFGRWAFCNLWAGNGHEWRGRRDPRGGERQGGGGGNGDDGGGGPRLLLPRFHTLHHCLV